MGRPRSHLASARPRRRGPSEALRASLRGRAAALRAFGYRDLDAEFLVAAGALGGHFLRRQYRQYAGCLRGGTDTRFLRLAESKQHIAPLVGRSLFRMRGSALFRAIRCKEGIARRERGWDAIRKRLLVVDYFLQAGETGTWLLSDEDKTSWFASRGIPAERFPTAVRTRKGRHRVFPDGFPVTVGGRSPDQICFSYSHAGSTAHSFRHHLGRHESIAASLACLGIDCEWVVLADSPVQFPRLRRAWRQWRTRQVRDWHETELFELRIEVDRRNWSALSREDVERYARLSSSLRGERVDRRYRRWVQAGLPPRRPGGAFAESCAYREVLLDRDYSIVERIIR